MIKMNNLEDIVVENSRLIYSLVKKYGNSNNREDLYQVGMIGLINAYKNFDSNYNTKFSTYAYMYIEGEIKKYIMNDHLIKMGRDYNKIIKNISKTENILEQKLMRKPTNYEIAHFLEIDEKIVDDLKASMYYIESLDSSINGEDEFTLYNTVSSNNDMPSIDYLFLKDEIASLPEKEQELIRYRYYMDKTQQEVADILGDNQVQVSRNEKKILKRIKTNYQM